MSRETDLARLLERCFSDDELRGHIAAGPGAADALAALPGHPTPLATLALAAVQVLQRRGLVDPGFFERLGAARPQRSAEIDRLRAAWLAAPPERSTVPIPDAADGALTRYRQVVGAAHDHMRLLGVARCGRTSTLPIDNLFVPLRLRGGRRRYSIGAVLSALERAGAARIVILGDPGSGKTTLCRYLVASMARTVEGAALVPFYLPLRDPTGASSRGSPSILERIREHAGSRLSVTLTEQELHRALSSGHAVVVLDGLDEVGDLAQRADICERIVAFAAAYPQAAVVVTSRIAGYAEAALPDAGPWRFARYRVEPFSPADLEAFMRRLYALETPDDPATQQRLLDGLLAALAAAPAVGALATNPLLATLIALVYAADRRLPAERAQLYERCVQTLLETWPELRGRGLPDLEVDVQRRCLEEVAWHMLDVTASSRSGTALVERSALLEVVASRLAAEPGYAGLARDGRRRAADRWIARFERENGLLVEESPGKFAFLHRSLGEYMAACRLERVLVEGSETAWLVGHARVAHWREVALLFLGRHARRMELVGPLYAALIDDPAGRRCLLGCLREGIPLSAEQLSPLITSAVIDHDREALSALADVARFTREEAGAIRAWFVAALSTAPLPALRDLLASAAHVGIAARAIVDALIGRHDGIDAQAEALRLLPPVREAGESAELLALAAALRERADGRAAMLAFAGVVPDKTTLAAAVAVMLGPASAGCRAALAVGLTRGAVWVMQGARSLAGALRLRWGAWSEVLPTGVRRWSAPRPAPTPIAAAGPRVPLLREGAPIAASVEPLLGYSIGEFACYAEAPPWEFLGYFLPTANVDVMAYIRQCSPEYWEAWYGRASDDDVCMHLDPDDHDARDEEEMELGNYTPEKCVVVDLHEALGALQLTAAQVEALPSDADPPWADLLAPLRAGDIDVGELLIRVIALHAAQAKIAVDLFPDDRSLADLHAQQRQAHTWIWTHWAAIDAALPDVPGPDLLALYLAIGWTQYPTTHRWPPGRRWQDIAHGPAPTHWWPRVHWLLRRLFEDPRDPTAWADIHAALAEGARDPDHEGVAVAVRALLA